MSTETPASPACVQERYAPDNRCFGCGPANPQGLRLRSFPDPEGQEDHCLQAEWQPAEQHQAFAGVLNGGIIGALLDCHSNWAAACFLMHRDNQDMPPCTVTADFHVRLRRPTALDGPVRLRAWPTSSEGAKVKVEAEMVAGGKVTATCTGTFVAVEPGHPAYYRR